MPVELNDKSARLAIFSRLIYEAEKIDKNDNRTSEERLTSAKLKEEKEFPHLGLEDYKYVKSNQDMAAFHNQKNNDTVIVYRGTNFNNNRDLFNDAAILANEYEPGPYRLNTALIFYDQVQKQFPNSKITLTGHSLGGTIAESVANIRKKNMCLCETFNRGVGVDLKTPILMWLFSPLGKALAYFNFFFPPAGDAADNNPHITSNIIEGDPISNRHGLGWERKYKVEPNINGKDLFFNHCMDRFIEKIKKNQNQAKGGVDLNVPIEQLCVIKDFSSINGFVCKEGRLSLSLDQFSQNFQGINLKDLVTVLHIFSLEEVESKNISFSLDPFDPKNPKGPFLEKVCWPDKTLNRRLLAGTEIFDVMFEADWLMKQLSIGVEVLSTNPLKIKERVYSNRMERCGIKPSYLLGGGEMNGQSESDWCRLWLVLKKIWIDKFSENKENGFFIRNVKMGVEARQMEIGPQGTLVDKVIQNPNHRSYKFAQNFTEHYDEISEEFPVFRRLAQVMKAVTLATWMWLNKIPLDTPRISAFFQNISKSSVTYQVPALEFSTKKDNISYHVFGGVELNIDYYHLIAEENKKFYDIQQRNINQIISSQVTKANLKLELLDFPLLPKLRCTKCEYLLNWQEMKTPHEKNFYCETHHPMICGGCSELICSGTYKNFKGMRFHAECLICVFCLKPLENEIMTYDNVVFLHENCFKRVQELSNQTSNNENKFTKNKESEKKEYFTGNYRLINSQNEKEVKYHEEIKNYKEVEQKKETEKKEFFTGKYFIIKPSNGKEVLDRETNLKRKEYDDKPEFGRTEKKIKKEFEIETRTEDLLELALELEEKSLGSFEMCYQSLVKFKGDINAVSNYLLDSKHN